MASVLADAYSSWQRGSTENFRGLFRETHPMKTNLAVVPHEELTHNGFSSPPHREMALLEIPSSSVSTRSGALDLTIHHIKIVEINKNLLNA